MNRNFFTLWLLLGAVSIHAYCLAQTPPIPRAPAHAEPKQGKASPPDSDPDCDGTSMQMLRCQERKVRALDIKLNSAYQRALKKVAARDSERGPALVDALRKSQRAWLTFKDANCKLYGELPLGREEWTELYTALCQAGALEERIEELNRISDNE